MEKLTLENVKTELGIDFEDKETDSRLQRYITVADEYLKGAIGKNYSASDERAKQLALFIIEDLYERRSYNVKENSAIQKMKNSLLMQLKWENENGNI